MDILCIAMYHHLLLRLSIGIATTATTASSVTTITIITIATTIATTTVT